MEERTPLAKSSIHPRAGLGIMVPRGPTSTADWSTAADDFARLERAGASVIWITDHLFWGTDVPEALALAGVAVGATRRCAVGTGVLQLPLRHPAAVAKAATTLQKASGGRFLLGLGTGEHRHEYELVGADFDARGATLDQALRTMHALWSPGDSRYEQRPAPGSMPLWFGGRRRPALRRVATWGQGWLPIFLSSEAVAEGVAALAPLLGEAGRSRADITVGATVVVAVTDDGWSRSRALDWMSDLWGVAPDRFERHLVSGDVATVVEQLEAYTEVGVEHLTILPASPEPVATFEAVAEVQHARSVSDPDQFAEVVS